MSFAKMCNCLISPPNMDHHNQVAKTFADTYNYLSLEEISSQGKRTDILANLGGYPLLKSVVGLDVHSIVKELDDLSRSWLFIDNNGLPNLKWKNLSRAISLIFLMNCKRRY